MQLLSASILYYQASMLDARLEKLLLKKAIPQALCFSGPAMDDLETIALSFAKKAIEAPLSSNPPDLHLYRPEGKTGMHSISTLRSLCQEVAFAPYESPLQFFVIIEADRMLPTSSNALLKTLEEPSSQTVIILLTSYPDRLPSTLLSRCHRLAFRNTRDTHLDPLQETLLNFFPNRLDLQAADILATRVEEERKEWEEELRDKIRLEGSLQEKESSEKEVAGMISLRYQERAFLLLNTLLKWYRDRWVCELHLSHELLFYPDRLETLKSTPFIPLPRLEKILKDTRLGIERGIKLHTCLEALFLQISTKAT